MNSGNYNGLVWDNPEKTMFRIPWKHAGKQDFRTEEDAAIFKVQMFSLFFLFLSSEQLPKCECYLVKI